MKIEHFDAIYFSLDPLFTYPSARVSTLIGQFGCIATEFDYVGYHDGLQSKFLFHDIINKNRQF